MAVFREEFEPPQGMRFWRDSLSIKVRTYALSSGVTDDELVRMAEDTNVVADTLRQVEPISGPMASRLVKPGNVPRLSKPRFFKYVSAADWDNYFSGGCFQLGSPSYYRTVENSNIRDEREGLSFISFAWAGRHMHWHVEAGNNCAVLCGTWAETAAPAMKAQFGSVLLEIVDAEGFAASICRTTGATDFSIRDVVYTDSKAYVSEEDFTRAADVPEGQTDTPSYLNTLNRLMFKPLCEHGLIAGAFAKPKRFERERERRFAFEFGSDLPKAPLRICDRSLLQYVRRIA